MQLESVVGWDLGGAHLKVARLGVTGSVERVMQLPCPLWQGIPHLERALDEATSVLGPAPIHAVTMTGEMVDLFSSRSEGVARLVTLMRQRFPEAVLRFYAGLDGFVSAEEAGLAGLRLASMNWMASGELVATRVGDALLVDIGSTTTDLVPVEAGRICARGHDDAGRLLGGELVYSGVVRTPLLAVASEAPFLGEWVPLMAELFATTADVHRLSGRLPEDADQHPAADGGEKTHAGSARRLARMIGRDAESVPMAAWYRLGAWLARAQSRRLEDACERLLSRTNLQDSAPLVGAGVGRFLAADIAARLQRPYCDFAQLLPSSGPLPEGVSDCAPAVAVAWLAQRASVGVPSPPVVRSMPVPAGAARSGG
ncbi:MAG TPA: hydantoinase/oxoprolinase family protein [Gemmatimonadales bacterium]|nr:hydantoinase/oxoprolinase family protein [Gemmatimonadales bacterium]